MRSEPAMAYTPLYRRVLGSAFNDLPRAVQLLHDTPASGRTWKGKADVVRGNSALAGLLCWLFGMPGAARDIPLELVMEVVGDREIWTRTFGRDRMTSVQSAGLHKGRSCVQERIGLMTALLALTCREGKVQVKVAVCRIAGLPMPGWLTPTGQSFEYEENGLYHFHVEAHLPMIGKLISYRGYLHD